MVRFGDVVRNGKASAEPETSGLERFVAGEHMDTDDLRIRRWGTIGEGYLGPAFHRVFKKGQVLYGSRRTYLRKVALADFDGICANTTFVLEPLTDALLPELLPFLLQTDAFVEHSIKQSKGSVNPYVNFSDLAWYEFPLPPLDEQWRIAEILWASTQSVQMYQEAALKARVMRNHAVDTLIGPANTVTQSMRRLESLVTMCQYGTSERASDEGDIPVIRMNNIQDGKIDPTDLRFLPRERAETHRYQLERGDILFNRTNSIDLVGKVGLFDLDGEFVFASYLIRLRADPSLMRPEYLSAFLNSTDGQRQLKSFATLGASQANINTKSLLSLVVPTPSLNVQYDAINRVKAVTRMIEDTEGHAERLRDLHRHLVHDLCTQV